MAEETKSPAPAKENPNAATIKRLTERKADLADRLKFLGTQKSSEAHDMDAAKVRTQNMIDEIDQELKRLAK